MPYSAPHYSSALEQAVDRYPLTVTPDTSLADAIALMGQLLNRSALPRDKTDGPDDPEGKATFSQVEGMRANCVLVVDKSASHGTEILSPPPEKATLLGIFTEQDLIQLIATGILDNPREAPLHKIRIGEVMSPVTHQLTESKDQDIFTALSMFRQHQILHLPVLDGDGYLAGAITPERIRQVLQPSNILRTRRVADEMIADVLTASANTSALDLAQRMATHQMSCVVIHEASRKRELTPVGIVTAQDIVLAQFLELDIARTPAKTIMGSPMFSLTVQDSLWVAHREMQTRQVQRLLVCDGDGKLQGIITQMSLLRILDPTEMYRVVKQLQQSVYQLQAEKMELLRSRNIRLEKQVQERTAQLHEQLQRERLLAKVSLQIHQSLNLEEILNATVAEVRSLLEADRVAIYHIVSGETGQLVAESAASGCRSISDHQLAPTAIAHYLQAFERSHIYTVQDIRNGDLPPAEVARLEREQIEAYLAVPILQDGRLWGIVEVQQCHKSRHWLPAETNLLQQLATQLAIAIYQAQLYHQVQALNTDLEKQVLDRTAELQQKVQELQQLNILKDDFLSTVSHELRTPLANMKMAIHMLQLKHTPERGERYLGILEAECSRETNLINDLLDLQKLEASAAPISLEVLNLSNWIPRITQPFYSRMQERQQVLKVECPPDLPPIRTNASNLERIVAELLNNACKYTPESGEIHFKIRPVFAATPKPLPSLSESQPSPHPAKSRDRLRLKISNQAEIPEKELPRIFDKFYRVQNADPWKQGGTGLGLALVEKLVEQLDGNIRVTSQDCWTTFTIDFPI